MSWTPSDLPDLTGTTALVTGANSGIGLVAALELARHGAEVTLACRDVAKGEAAAAGIRRETGSQSVRVEQLDLASLDSVADLAARWEGPLGLLVNNAGVMTPPAYRETADGFELQMGTNHLGHFALTARLLPSLLAAAGEGRRSPRVVTVASVAHLRGDARMLELNPREGYSRKAYAQSKLANLVFALELHRRLTAAGSPLVSTAAHPGVTATNLFSSPDGMGSVPLVGRVAPLVLRALFQPASAGAVATLYAATEAEPRSYTGPQRMG